jgi:thiamine transport system substrate-binding protein
MARGKTDAVSSATSNDGQMKELVVYAYDSFVADWGPGPELIKRFEAKTGCKVTMISCGDAAQVLSRAVLEKKNPGADVLVGIDNNLLDVARKEGILAAYKPANADAVVAKDLVLSDDWLLTPYDWSYFAMIFDTASGIKPPASLEDLTKPEYAKKIILMDPRTSTPGTGFLAWTLAVYGAKYVDYWTRLKGNILTMAPGWDTGYGLFTSGEAPLVISYTTSPAYHVENDKTNRYQALVFAEGHPAQVEGLGLVNGAKNATAAKAFIDFMLTDEAQSVLPLTQWMYPVSKTVKLPDSYKAAPLAPKKLTVPSAEVGAAIAPVMGILNK